MLERALRAAEREPALRADVQMLRVRRWHAAGNVVNAATLAVAEARAVLPHDPACAARLAVEGLLCWIHVGDVNRALRLADELCSRRLPEPGLELAARIARAWALTARAEREGPRLLAEVGAEHELPGPHPVGATAYVGLLHLLHGDHATARDLLLRVELASRRQDAADLHFVLAFRAGLEYRTGSWRSGESLARESVELARRRGVTNALGDALFELARIEAMTGRREEALEHLAEANEISLRAGTVTLGHAVATVRGAIALLDGDVDLAVGHLRGTVERLRALGVRHPGFVDAHADLVEALARAGLEDEARRWLDELEQTTLAVGCPPGTVSLARARLALCPDEDLDQFDELARHEFHERPVPFERARTLLALGARRRRAGERSRARADLAQAMAELERLGAEPWVELARAELRAAGGQPTASRRVAEPGPLPGLTAQESQVALAVGRGASNREVAASLYLSVKTIERHLTSIYTKLGLRSRSELLVWLAEQSALVPGPRGSRGIPPGAREGGLLP